MPNQAYEMVPVSTSSQQLLLETDGTFAEDDSAISSKRDNFEHSAGKYIHRDLLGRLSEGENRTDKTVSPYGARLCDLHVQASRDVLAGNSKAIWYRQSLRNGSPWMIRLSNWALSRDHGPDEPAKTNLARANLRWIPAYCALAFIVSV